MTEKQQMMSGHVGNWWRHFECCILNTKEVRSSNKFKKHWSARVTDEFASKTLLLRKSLSSLYTKCVLFFCDPLYSFAHAMWVKWWYHAKFQHFQSSFCSAFQFQGPIAQKISKCMKNNKWSQKGLKIDDVALNGAFWTRKKSGVQISLKNIEVPV